MKLSSVVATALASSTPIACLAALGSPSPQEDSSTSGNKKVSDAPAAVPTLADELAELDAKSEPLHERLEERRRRLQSSPGSCFGAADFALYFKGRCNYDDLVARMTLKVEEHERCINSGAEEVMLLVGVADPAKEDEARAKVRALCQDAMDKFAEDPNTTVEWDQVTDKGAQFDKEYYDGNTYWNEEHQTEYDSLIPGEPANILKRDAERVDDLYETVARRLQFKWPEHLTNFDSCKTRSAMCCWVSDRQAGDNNGNCATPYDQRCTDADPGDNTDLCAVDMARSPSSNHMNDGFALYDQDEGPVHCHGLAWGNDVQDPNYRYRANNLFYVSMSDHMHDRGYVRNVPAAPMCACTEQMPIVTRADCTEINPLEFWKFDWSEATQTFTATLDRAEVRFQACRARRNNDLQSFYERLKSEGLATRDEYHEFSTTVVGNGRCNQAIQNLLVDKGYEYETNIEDWSMVYGKGALDSTAADSSLWQFDGTISDFPPTVKVVDDPIYIRRICRSCSHSHKDIIYKRLTPWPQPDGQAPFDIQSLFLDSWFDNGRLTAGNQFTVDFNLFSSFEEALIDSNPWTYCNFNDPGIGFPRDCGPKGRVTRQWNSLNRGGQPDVAFYVYDPVTE